MNKSLSSIDQLQEIGFDDRLGWRIIQAPLNGFRLKMNLPYIKRIGYSTPKDLSRETIESYGYGGAIQLKNGATTYLYR